MSVFSKLILGTANFGRDYNNSRIDDPQPLLDYCIEVGIDKLDVATGYGTEFLGIEQGFKRYVKVPSTVTKQQLEKIIKTEPACIMIHGGEDVASGLLAIDLRLNGWRGLTGLSIYESSEWWTTKPWGLLQIPYSLLNQDHSCDLPFYKKFGEIVQARSIFLRGKCLEIATPFECLAFVLANPYIDQVVVGVDNLEQLKQICEPWRRLENSAINDPNIIDPRRWKE